MNSTESKIGVLHSYRSFGKIESNLKKGTKNLEIFGVFFLKHIINYTELT